MKLAIICSGGGMRCAYSGGALVALAKKFTLTTPDIVIGISGGAASLTYFLSHQYDAIEHIWTNLVATPKFISFQLHKSILNIDYLIDTVLKKESPLDVETFKQSPTQWFFSTADTRVKKQTRYFSKNDSVDIFEILRASMAVPFFYGRRVILQKIGYRDGDLGLTLEEAIKHASGLGATHFIVIESHPETLRARLIDMFYKKIFFTDPPRSKIQGTVIDQQNIIHIRNVHAQAGPLTRDQKKLRSTYDQGYSDTINYPNLQEFLLPFQNLN